MPSALRQVLAKKGFAVLDGALGTELGSRGFDVSSRLWSAAILLDEVLVLPRCIASRQEVMMAIQLLPSHV